MELDGRPGARRVYLKQFEDDTIYLASESFLNFCPLYSPHHTSFQSFK
jgi:hypothetical protein